MTAFNPKEITIPEGSKTLIFRGNDYHFLTEEGAGQGGIRTLNIDWRRAVAKDTETELLFRTVTNPEDPAIPLLANGIIVLGLQEELA